MLFTSDVISVWDNVSEYITKQMTQAKVSSDPDSDVLNLH